MLAQVSDKISFADAEGAITAMVSATAWAFAEADSLACGSGEFSATTFVGALSSAIAQPYIDVCALAYAMVMPGAAVADILVTANNGVLQVTDSNGFSAIGIIENGKRI